MNNARAILQAVILMAMLAISGTVSAQNDIAPPTGSGSVQQMLDDHQKLLNTEQFRQIEATRQQQNQRTINAVSNDLLDEVKARLPGVQGMGTQLANGPHAVVSPNGNATIARILELLTAKPEARAGILQQLQQAAQQGVPEAQNFMGFASEFGAFGAPVNLAVARAFYQAAAQSGYQPALYNLALLNAYGRGVPANLRQGLVYSRQALAKGTEISYRVCGMASFLAYKNGQGQIALQAAQGCISPLAGLAVARYNSALSVPARVQKARDSLLTGVDDGFAVIHDLMRNQNGYTACRYALVQQYLYQGDLTSVKTAALTCYRQSTRMTGTLSPVQQQEINGLASFTLAEVLAIRKHRAGNRMHYGWPVPYLPFPAYDAERFAPCLKGSKR